VPALREEGLWSNDYTIPTPIGLLKEGRPVHSGIAIFTPSVDLEGETDVNVKIDQRISSALNAKDVFTGEVTTLRTSARPGQAREDLPSARLSHCRFRAGLL
jgi:hypothetical protein